MNTIPWWSLITLREDIQKNILDDSLFVADLGDVITQRAPQTYADAKTFFDTSVITRSSEMILKAIFARLASDYGGNPVIQLQSSFGGGKTHTLVMVYHSIKNLELLDSIPDFNSLDLKKLIKEHIHPHIAVFVGTQYDIIREKTPWGIIAEQFGQYQLLEEHDKKRISPGKNLLVQLLTTVSPGIILIDELLPYITKYTTYETQNNMLAGQVLTFIQELTEAIATVAQTCLIITLPKEELEVFDESAKIALQKLKKLVSRIGTIYSPVEEEDIPRIIRKRLFSCNNTDNGTINILKQYHDYYSKEKKNFPPEISDPSYLTYMEQCYPFHPELVDLLINQWTTFPYFQKIRGILRILAKTVHVLGKLKISNDLIRSADIPLFDEEVRLECLNYLDPKIEMIIKTDLIGKKALLNLIIDKLPVSSRPLALNIANAIFMYSFSTNNIAGLTINQLNLCIFQPNIQLNIVYKILYEMQSTLWYLHKENDKMYFNVKPNVNSLIAQIMAGLNPDDIDTSLKKFLYNLIEENSSIFQLWIDQGSPAADSASIKIGIVSPKFLYENQNFPSKEDLKTILTKTKRGPRVNQNMLILLLADKSNYTILEKLLRKQIAIDRIRANTIYTSFLDQESTTYLKTVISQIKNDLKYHMLATYRHLIMNKNNQDVLHHDLGIPDKNETKDTIVSRIFKQLRESEILLDELPLDYLLRKVFSDNSNSISLEELWNLFTRIPAYPLLLSRSPLDKAVIEGMQKNILKVKTYDEAMLIPEDNIIHGDPNQIYIEKIHKNELQQVIITKEQQIAKINKKVLLLEVTIPNDKIDQFITGVVKPLQLESIKECIIKLKVEVSPNIIENNTISTIKETLHQIRAKVTYLNENYIEEN